MPSIRESLVAERKRINPGAARDIDAALRAAIDSPVEIHPRLANESEILDVTCAVLDEMKVTGEDGVSVEKMIADKYPTFDKELYWPQGQLSNKVTKEGWTASFRNAVLALIQDYGMKRPGNWQVMAYERFTNSAQTETVVTNVIPDKSQGLIVATLEQHRPYQTFGVAVRFVDVSNSPPPRYDAMGRVDASTPMTINMPPEFTEAMAEMTAALTTARAQAPGGGQVPSTRK